MRRPRPSAPLALALLACLLAPPAARAIDPADAPVRRVRFYPLEGLPGDSLIRFEFAAGFDSVFAADSLPVERNDRSSGWRAGGRRANRFQLEPDSAAHGAWTLQVVVGAPPPYVGSRRNPHTNKSERHVDTERRASRGMTLAVLALSPEAIRAGARAMPEHYAFAFPPEAAPATVFDAIPSGFIFPWRESGKVSALLALELLHQRSGDFPTSARCSLVPVQRVAVVR